MINFIKCYTIKNLKFKLLILYSLNITDILLTFLLLNTGFYKEVNIIMVKVVQSSFASFILKVILPAILLFYILIRLRKASAIQLRQSNTILNIIITFYTIINIFHLVWCMLIPAFLSYY